MRIPRGPASPAYSDPSPDRLTTLYMLLLLTHLPVVSSDLTPALTEDSTSQHPRHSTNTTLKTEPMHKQTTCINNTDIDKDNSTDQEHTCTGCEDIKHSKSVMEEVVTTVDYEETDIDETYRNNHTPEEAKLENDDNTGNNLEKNARYENKETVEKENSFRKLSELENGTNDDNSTYDDFISSLYLDTLILPSNNNENDTHSEDIQESVFHVQKPADGNITNGVVSDPDTYLLNGSLGNLSETPDNGLFGKKGVESKSSIESSPTTHTPRPRYNTTPRLSHRESFLAGLGHNSSGRIVSILGLFELSTRGVARAEGRSELAAARLAVRHVNRNNLLPGYSLQLITNDTKCDAGVGVDRFFHALYTENSRMVMLLGTACSEVTESLAKVVPYWNMVQVSFGSTSPALSDRSEFPLFYRTVAPDSSHNPARIAFIRKFGWDTVTAFSQNEEVYSLAVNELVTELEAANITCAASITFAETDLEEQLQQLKELDTRIIIGSFSPELMPKIFCEAYRLGMYGEEYAWIVSGSSLFLPPPPAPCPANHLTEALDALVLVDAHNGIVGNNVSFAGLTNDMFRDELRSMGVGVSPYAPQTYDAVWSIALALRNSERTWMSIRESYSDNEVDDTFDRLDPSLSYGLGYFDYSRKDMAEEFLIQLGKLKFLGVSGPVSFNGADRVGTSAFHQIQEGVTRTVALYSGGNAVWCQSCAEARWGVRGVPPVARRVLRMRIDAVWAPARVAGATLAAAGVLLALAFLGFNLHYSKRRSIKLSSPRLNNMTLIGCILVYASVALLGLDNATLPSFIPFSAMCTGRVYILSAGFSLAFGSMFAKTYRVHRIFISNRSGVCKTKLLQDTQLISLVCALLLIDGLIVTLWAITDPMERHLKNLTIEISATDRSVVYQPQIEVCKSQNTAGWLCALYAYKGLLLLVGVYMAWETRNVKISALNDSKYIGISVYSVVITSASVVVLGTIISERATLAYITITSLILVSTTATLCLLFLPKIITILDKSEDDPVIQSMGLKLECNTRRFVTDETQELHFRTEIQNKVYRREMAALDKEINRLEKLLESNPTSTSSSTVSVALHRKIESSIEEIEEARKLSCAERRTPSITGGLPLLLLSVLPPVIPRASWPSADHTLAARPQVNFSSQPKLDQRRSQPAIDLYNLFINRNTEENTGFLSRLRNMFVGSRPTSRKASTMSIADPTGQGIAAALKMHMGMIAGLVPSSNKNSMVVSCNTLNVPQTDFYLRRESYAKSGPIIHIIDEPSTSAQTGVGDHRLQMKRKPQKYIAESETKVNFVLPEAHRRPSVGHQSSCERIKGSPRFPHRISPATSSLSTLDDRRKTSGDVFCISRENFGQPSRRNSHQPFDRQSGQSHTVLENRWKSVEDATAHVPSKGS